MTGAFRTVEHRNPLRVVVVGAGAMGRRWMRNARDSADVELVGVADIFDGAAASAVADLQLENCETGTDGVELALRLRADALINVTIPAAHHPVTTAALKAGLPVIGEKPAAETVAEALSLAAAAEVTGELFVVSQSRRYDTNLFTFRQQVAGLGRVGVVNVDFFRNPGFEGFRREMNHPLLLDMAIHPFDSVRFLLGVEPVSVTCEEFNPSWSAYRGDAAASVAFTMSDGSRFLYNASWASPGFETSWNASWRASGEFGTALWNGDDAPVTSVEEGEPGGGAAVPPGESIAGSLADFVTALREGVTPLGEIHENVMSLAMVEAAVTAATRGTRVELDEILDAALTRAVDDESDAAVRAVLSSWPSAREALARGPRAALNTAR